MREPKAGDLVIHIRDSILQGRSIVERQYREEQEEPPEPGAWARMAPYYRIDLRQYQDFPRPVSLADFIREHQEALTAEIQRDHPQRFPFQLEQSGRVKQVQGAYVCRATQNLFDLIRASVGLTLEPPDNTVPPFSIEEATRELFLDKREFEEILEALEGRKNVILQGPPGVGKSFIAKRLAYALIGHRDATRVAMVQFHQSYAYEDFVQG
jgi:Novel STAND NTPase 3